MNTTLPLQLTLRIARACGSLARYLGTGQLDTTFGSGGLVTTSFGNSAVASISALALQGDGKIVAVGTNSGTSFVAARYLSQ